MLTLIKTDTTLRIEPDDLEALAECKSIEDALEDHLCNGWEIIAPADVGALTDGLLITDDAERDDQGALVRVGTVYWDERYQIEDALEELQAGRAVEFRAGD